MDNTETTPSRLADDYHLHSERKRIRWDPTINMGHIVTMMTSMVMSLVFVMASWSTMDKRVVVLEEARLAAAQINRDNKDQMKEKFDDVRDGLREMKNSLDSLRRDMQQRKP